MNARDSNGLPLLSHIHKCFEARLLSIHPTTYRIRIFAWYDILNEYDGKIADVSADVDPIALRHHWDMCCLENIVAQNIPEVPDLSSKTPPTYPLPSPAGPSGALPAPPTAAPPTTSSPEDHGQSTSETTGNQRCVAHNALDDRVHPLSPPSSVTVVQIIRWQIGGEVITDPKVAERLRDFGWDLSELPEETDEGCSRPCKRQRRVSSWRIGAYIIEDEYEAQRLRDQGWAVEEVCEEEDLDGAYLERGRPLKRRSFVPEETAATSGKDTDAVGQPQ